MKLHRKLLFATAVSICFAATANPVQSATITYNFKANATSGTLLNQTFTGFLSYDDSTLRGVGAESLAPADGLNVSFNFLGSTYTQKNDVNYPELPLVNFNSGSFKGLDFFVNDSPKIFGINSNNFSYRGEQVGEVTYTRTASVPEPEMLPGLAVLGLSGLFLKKKWL